MCVVLSLLQVFKVLVRKTPDESWVVFRRYTDFSRLNDKVCLGVLSVQMFEDPCLSFKCRWFQISGLSEDLFSILPCLQTLFITIYLSLSACFLLFLSALCKWLEPNKEALCSQITNRPEPTRGQVSRGFGKDSLVTDCWKETKSMWCAWWWSLEACKI